MSFKKIKLKGGSLCGTYLIKNKNKNFVRKEISLTHNREYGYQRWYSQYKKLQRYSVTHPNIFPNILNMGVMGDITYFDIDYVTGSETSFDFISKSNENSIDVFFGELLSTMKRLHSKSIPSNKGSMGLYLHEEIDCRLNDTLGYDKFKEFMKYEIINFQGENIPSFLNNLETYKKIALKYYTNPIETFTHGNLTLENILYVKDKNNVVFIDPYEENVIDSELSEISQLLQSSNSLYEIYNEGEPLIEGNKVQLSIDIPRGITYFNKKLNEYIVSNYSVDDRVIIKVLEISQFIRMLPFKVGDSIDKTLFFYSLASKLLDNLIKEIKI